MRSVAVTLALALLGACATHSDFDRAPASTSGTVSPADFLAKAGQVWDSLPAAPSGVATSSGTGVSFVPLRSLIRGQDQISIDNILFEKLAERQKNQDIVLDAQAQTWELKNDLGRSSVPLADPILGIRGPQGILVIDGHHDLFLGLYVGAQSIAINVKEDLSSLSPIEFWKTMKQRNLVYLPQDAESLAKSPPEMMKVRDNPNRYLATLLALKVATDSSPNLSTGALEIKAVKGAKVPVWIKLNNSIPFVEFFVARILSDAGIFYDASWGRTVPDAVIERARVAMLAARTSGKYPQLKGLSGAEIPLIESHDDALKAAGGGAPLKAILARSAASCREVFGAP